MTQRHEDLRRSHPEPRPPSVQNPAEHNPRSVPVRANPHAADGSGRLRYSLRRGAGGRQLHRRAVRQQRQQQHKRRGADRCNTGEGRGLAPGRRLEGDDRVRDGLPDRQPSVQGRDPRGEKEFSGFRLLLNDVIFRLCLAVLGIA